MRQITKLFFAFAIFLISPNICKAEAARQEDLPQAKFQSNHWHLANGLEVIHVPVHKAPVILHMLWYHVGSKDESAGKTGIAHFLEHLMFKSTKKYAAGEFTKEIAAIGGIENAFTTDDMTVYYQQIQKQSLPKIMEREAERMQLLQFDSSEIEKERDIILEERRMRFGNVPEAQLVEQMRSLFFALHPYHNPTIGWEDDIKNLSQEDLYKFYRRWYQPQNATLVVVGDIELEKLKPLVQRYYGVLKSAGIKISPKDREKAILKEPQNKGNISVNRSDALAKTTMVMQYYKAPNLKQNSAAENPYAMQVLAALLGGGSTSRIYQTLVEKQKVAVAVKADYDPLSYGPAVFALLAIPRMGVSAEKLHQGLSAQLQQICASKPTETEVSHFKQTLVTNALFAQEDLTALGTVYGRSAIAGLGPEYVESWTQKIAAVDANSVNAAACTLIAAQYNVFGTLSPEINSNMRDKNAAEKSH